MEEFSSELATSRLSLQFFIYESMVTILFLLVTGLLLLGRRMVFFISNMLFVRREDIPDNVEKQDIVGARIITIALLVAIALVVGGSFGLLVQYLINLEVTAGVTLIEYIVTFVGNGALCMILSGLVLISMWLLIFLIYIQMMKYTFSLHVMQDLVV